MKKILIIILVIIFNILCFNGCTNNNSKRKFETDGTFTYQLSSNGASYRVCELLYEDTGSKIYIPPYFNNIPIRKVGYLHQAFGRKYSYLLNPHKDSIIYYPYTCDFWGGPGHSDEYGTKKQFFINCEESTLFWIDHAMAEISLRYDYWGMEEVYGTAFVSREGLDCMRDIIKNPHAAPSREDTIEEENRISVYYGVYNENLLYVLCVANTSYMFNYDEAPNKNYFFINDFERGGLIENTPYEPTREGYAFAGWYKEPECINAWDFAVDTLPEPEYDEDGDLIFVETKLYAKWI